MTHEAMAQVAEQRERLAERARLPCWFWVVMGPGACGVLAALATPQPWSWTWLLFVVSLVVIGFAERLVRRATGLRLSTRTMRDFPSTRLRSIVAIVLWAVGCLATLQFAARSEPLWAWTAAAATVVVFLAGTASIHRAMRSDIRAGRVRHP